MVTRIFVCSGSKLFEQGRAGPTYSIATKSIDVSKRYSHRQFNNNKVRYCSRRCPKTTSLSFLLYLDFHEILNEHCAVREGFQA